MRLNHWLVVLCLVGVLFRGGAEDFLWLGWADGLGSAGPGPTSYYNGGDDPSGVARIDSGAGQTNNFKVTTPDGRTIPAGTYKVGLKILAYNPVGVNKILARVGDPDRNVSVWNVTDDRDGNKQWTDLGNLSLPFGTNAVTLSLWTTNGGLLFPGLIQSLYLTENLGAQFTSDDYSLTWEYPTVEDVSAVVPGNLLRNSSWEAGFAGGWGIGEGDYKTFAFEDALSDGSRGTPGGWHGPTALRISVGDCAVGQKDLHIWSPPIRLRPNRRHTLSAWVRAETGTCNVKIALRNPVPVPSGLGLTAQTVHESAVTTVGTTWTRVVLANQFLREYPFAEYAVELKTSFTVGLPAQAVLWDAVQLEEGGTASAYAPMFDRELEFYGKAGMEQLFLVEDNDTAVVAKVVNMAAAAGAGGGAETLNWEVRDEWFRSVASGTAALTVPVSPGGGGVSFATANINLNSLPLGTFRLNGWLSGSPSVPREWIFARVHRPRVVANLEDGSFGIHAIPYHAGLRKCRDLGFTWCRRMSPGAYLRWSLVEPTTPGSYVWYDKEVQRDQQWGLMQLGNLTQTRAAFNNRTYFGLTGISGSGFVVGESVSQGSPGTGVGVVTWVSVVGDPLHPAIQMTVSSGAFATTGLLTGGTSGTTATPATASVVYNSTPALDRWGAYVQATVAHYAPITSWWEIGNEPNQDTQLPGHPNNQAFYAQMLRIGVASAKAANPNCKILGVGGAFSAAWVSTVWGYLDAGTKAAVDAVSMHFYPGQAYQAVTAVPTLAALGINSLWNNESGVWSSSYYSGENANWRRLGYPLQPFRDSEDGIRGSLVQPGVIQINLVETIGGGFKKWMSYDGRYFHAPFNWSTHSTIFDMDGVVKPAAVALSWAAWALEGGMGGGKMLNPPSALTVGYYVTGHGGVPWAVLWNGDRTIRRATVGLSAGQYSVFNQWGNETPPAVAGTIDHGRHPAWVRGNGISLATLKGALDAATWSTVADTRAPGLEILDGPRGVVDARQKHSLRMRWVGGDEISVAELAQPNAMRYRTRLDGGAWTAWTSDCTWYGPTNLVSGSHVFEVEGRDEALNVAPMASRTFVW